MDLTDQPLGLRYQIWWRVQAFAIEAGKALAVIVAGLVLISAFNAWYDLQLKAVFAFSFTATDADWNTVRAIWVAEVPLAFLLRYALRQNRTEFQDQNFNDFDALHTAMTSRGIDNCEHLRFAKVLAKGKTKGSPKHFYAVNLDTGLAYETMNDYRFGAFWTLEHKGVVDNVLKGRITLKEWSEWADAQPVPVTEKPTTSVEFADLRSRKQTKALNLLTKDAHLESS